MVAAVARPVVQNSLVQLTSTILFQDACKILYVTINFPALDTSCWVNPGTFMTTQSTIGEI
jgi:hypothetical protein